MNRMRRALRGALRALDFSVALVLVAALVAVDVWLTYRSLVHWAHLPEWLAGAAGLLDAAFVGFILTRSFVSAPD